MPRVLRFVPPLSRRATAFMLVVAAAIIVVAAALFVEAPAPQGARAGGERATSTPSAVDERALIEPGAAMATDDVSTGAPSPATPALREGIANAKMDPEGASAGTAVIGTEPSIGSGATLAAPSIDAKIVRTASMELRTKRGGFEDAWSDTTAVAGLFGGTVLSASRSGSGDGPRTGTITLRIPSDRFDKAVERLRDTPRTSVRRLDIASQDVTQEYVDVRSRLRHDRAVEGRLLALLAQTEGVGEVLAVQSRLDQVQEQIEISTGRLGYLATMTATSTVDVTLRDPGAKAAAKADDRGSVLGDALRDARAQGSENVAAAIIWLGGALPALVLLTIVAIVARVAWRRRSSAR